MTVKYTLISPILLVMCSCSTKG